MSPRDLALLKARNTKWRPMTWARVYGGLYLEVSAGHRADWSWQMSDARGFLVDEGTEDTKELAMRAAKRAADGMKGAS